MAFKAAFAATEIVGTVIFGNGYFAENWMVHQRNIKMISDFSPDAVIADRLSTRGVRTACVVSAKL
jgi:hypothetical protein